MEGVTLTSRAIVFAICAGATAFILALFATSAGHFTADSAARAVIPAIVCGAMCWASAERSIASTAAALDSAIERIARAADGDLNSPIPREVEKCVPQLAGAMDSLFDQLHNNLENVQRLAMFDPVTGLANRVNFRRNCERALGEMGRERNGALFFIDLDRFKNVNDTLGHAMGDGLLGMVANRLRAVADRFASAEGLRPLLGRLAGDEFTMFYPDILDVTEADRIGRAILFALGEPFDLAGQQVKLGASVGVAMRPRHGLTLTDLMRAADAAMYHAKANGRGRVEHFSDTLADAIADRARLENDLRDAVDNDDFALVFQPQICARTGSVVGAEALLRWRHPDGLRMPGNFIGRAEETGLIVEIGQWVTGTVAQTIARWADAGIGQRLAVNISARQIDHVSFFRSLRQALRDADAPASLLELEITENLAMTCSDDVLAAIAALRDDGASVAIDDFGTGYSNLARLRRLPVDRIKLDHSMIRNVADTAEARTIAQAVIALIHGIGCTVVAEGIENEAEADVLRVIGCDILQGYAIGEPMAEAEFIDWMREGNRRLIA
ncbi:EAL domain-containing protein [Stakelama sp. CBK3Z-3]|uniref:EAL domain-containing protein n=1 Tax=Stakelama flava TaxID=2860338 RepID=A0ABS6XR51_9SPHN|nr:EAL domain-containing protein [Stakelama flava]MBW4332278.1 EAL domain-containing protein [Stakelama flava]